MYSRSTERRGRTHLPPGYDGSAFRHDTGERRMWEYPTETKVHSGMIIEQGSMVEQVRSEQDVVREQVPLAEHGSMIEQVQSAQGSMIEQARSAQVRSEQARSTEPKLSPVPVGERAAGTFLTGMLDNLGREEWLLLFVLLLLLADGSDAWEVILLLCVLLAVR